MYGTVIVGLNQPTFSSIENRKFVGIIMVEILEADVKRIFVSLWQGNNIVQMQET